MPLSHPRSYVRWEQLSLFPANVFTFEITCHLDARSETLQLGIASSEGPGREPFSLHVSGTKLSSANVDRAVQIIRIALLEAAERLEPIG